MTLNRHSYGVILLAVSIFLAGCDLGSRYSGDGEFVELGSWPFVNYEVRFPPMDLARDGRQEFNFSGLPDMESVVGITIDTRRTEPCDKLKESLLREASVRLELVRNRGEVIVEKMAPLADWAWSYPLGGPYQKEWSSKDCFVYGRDMYFPPEEESNYVLRISVESKNGKPYTARAVIKSFAVYAP